MSKWDIRFMDEARLVSQWSKDPNTQVGALLVSPNRSLIIQGYNGFPRPLYDAEFRLNDRELKNRLTIHAELNALLNAPVPVEGWCLYCTLFPCTQCALAVIQKGIKRVVAPWGTHEKWRESQEGALKLFNEAGVRVVAFNS